MKALVYTIAVGESYSAMAGLMVASLSRFGQFDGTLHIVKDIPDAVRAYPFYYAKSFLGQTMDLSGFDYVLYLDADVLVTGPIAPLFTGDTVRAFHEYEELSPEQWDHFALGPYQPGRPGINAGILVSPAAIWNQTCTRWWERLQFSGVTDQLILNEMIAEGAIPFERLPAQWATSTHPAAISRPFSNQTILMHCHCCADRLVVMTRFWECLCMFCNRCDG